MAYDPSAFEAQRRAAQGGFAAQSAMNEYARFLAQQRGRRDIQAFERETAAQIPRFGRSFGRRGLYGQGVRSGIFNRALSDFGQAVTRQRGELQQGLEQEERGFQLRQSQFQSALENALADIEAQKARQISETATGLLNL